jgi:hypothetical protein
VTELQIVSEQLRAAFAGDPWHGESLATLLEDVSAEAAASHPVPGTHSIWELVLHIGAWLDILERALHGSPMPQDSMPGFAEMNFPPVRSTDAKAWEEAKARLFDSAAKMAHAAAAFDPQRLTAKVPGRDYDFRFALGGIADHCIYHAGQIGILKKAITTKATK